MLFAVLHLSFSIFDCRFQNRKLHRKSTEHRNTATLRMSQMNRGVNECRGLCEEESRRRREADILIEKDGKDIKRNISSSLNDWDQYAVRRR
jgi:hypothetical protein